MKLNLFNRFKSEIIKDSYFGEMGIEYNTESKKYYLDKDIDEISTPIILYIESSQKSSSIDQQKSYENIIENFGKSWNSVIKWLTEKEKLVTRDEMKKKYRIESITIPDSVNPKEYLWELDLINLEDGFSRIVIEMKISEPINYSIEA